MQSSPDRLWKPYNPKLFNDNKLRAAQELISMFGCADKPSLNLMLSFDLSLRTAFSQSDKSESQPQSPTALLISLFCASSLLRPPACDLEVNLSMLS